MHYYEVAPNQIIRIDSDSFTYSSDTELPIGQIVLIEVGKNKIIGIVIRKTKKPTYQTKSIIEIIEPMPIPSQLVDLSLWLSKYYATPLATVLQSILPRGLQKNRRKTSINQNIIKRNRTNIVFNTEQLTSLDAIAKSSQGTFLLQGVTGSGKTEVYIETVKQSINAGKSAIMLVPEIALTSQLIAEFSNHFDDLLVTHSRMTESNRHKIWQESLTSEKPRIIIGPRSALFTPLKDIGVIIIDEAHEPSYKQEQSPKYSALRAATMLGRFHNAKVIFGSATPSVIDRYLAEKSDNKILKLTKSARITNIPPATIIIDMTKRNNFTKHRFLSNQLISQIEETLAINKQILIFHNRRGSTSSTLCKDCSWTAECPRCFLPLTLHTDSHKLKCHICNFESGVPTYCPKCSGTNIIFKGIGTKLIESELKKLFPNVIIARFDADNKDDEAVNARYQDLYDGKINIAIGTQVVAKGLDLPHLRTVCVIQADAGLAIPDFNTNERTFQLLAQVVGRVGRSENKTNVVIQTYQPNHPSIVHGISQNYESFYEQTLIERKRSLFPPFTHLLKITCSYKTEESSIKNTRKLALKLRNSLNKSVQILGPTPAFYERQNDNFRWQLILKSPKREYLIDALRMIPAKNFQFELDPTSLV